MKRMETYQTSFPLGDESSQMWTLNKRLEAYLSRVKTLEEENELLRAEIHHLRKESKVPSVRKYHEEILKLRDALDDGHQKMVEVEMARDQFYQEVEHVRDLCLQEKQAQEEAKKEISESKKVLEEERRAQTWLKERLAQLEEEMEDILRVHEEEKAAMEEEMSSFSQRLDSFKVVPIAFQPVNLEDYSMKLSQIWQGAVEDYKSEVSDLESSLSEAKENLRKVLEENKQSQLQLQNLDRELLSLKSRKELLEEVLGKQWLDQQEEEGRLQLEIETLEKEKQNLRAQIAQILEDRQQLMHLKMSLSLEVATYRSLLEAESTQIYSPTTDYKLSSPFSEHLLEKTPLHKRQAESTKTPVARDYRCISTKRQSAEKSEHLLLTPSRYLNVRSTPFPSRPSPATKEFQKVSSVLQSQSLNYTKASTEKAATTLSPIGRRIERHPPTEDVFKKSKVETISHSYSQGSSKVRSESRDRPLDKTVCSKNNPELKITEAFENGLLLHGEKDNLDAQLKTLESSLKTVEDHHLMGHDTAMESQQGSLKCDIGVQDLHSNDQASKEKDKQTELVLPSQVFDNLQADLAVEEEEFVTEVMMRERVFLEKQEVVQSLEFQNTETLMKEGVKDHKMLQAIIEPYTSDAMDEVSAITPTHEEESFVDFISVERGEPNTLSSDVKPLTRKEQELNVQVSFDLEHGISLSGAGKEGTNQWADEKDTLLVNQGFEVTEEEQDSSSSAKVEPESKLQEKEVLVDQQIVINLKESKNQLLNDEKFIEDKSQEEEKPVGPSDIIFDSPESFEKCPDDALNGLGVNKLSKEIQIGNTEQQTGEVTVSQEVHSLYSEIVNIQQKEIEEDIKITNKILQEDLHFEQSQSLLEEGKASPDTVIQEENLTSDIKEEIHYFEEVKTCGIEDRSHEYDTEQSCETYDKEEFDRLLRGSKQIFEDSENSQEQYQIEQKSLELYSLEQESEIYTERKTKIICVTEHITEQFIVDNKEDIDQLDATQPQYTCLSETALKEIQKELESLEFGNKEPEIHDALGTGEGTQIFVNEEQMTNLESERAEVIQDTVQLLENVKDIQDVKLEEQKLSEPGDAEQSQHNPGQELSIQLSEGNQNLLYDHDSKDNVLLLNTIDDGEQSLDRSQEQFCDIRKEISIEPEIEPVDSLPFFQEEKKDIDQVQTEQDNKLSLDQESSPSDSQETIIFADDGLEEAQSDGKTSPSFDKGENDIVEWHKPHVTEEGDVPQETDGTTTLQNESVEQPWEEEYQQHIKQDIADAPTTTNTVQENQPEEHESEDIFTGTNKTEEDMQFNESEQATQELVDAIACVLLKEEVLLESPILTEGVQEPEPDSDISYKQENIEQCVGEGTEEKISQVSCETVSQTIEKDTSEENEEDCEGPIKTEATQEPELDHESLFSEEAKTIYQQESVLDIDKGIDEEIIEESSEVVSTMAENVFSETNEEVEQLGQTESAAVSIEHESHTPEMKMQKYISGSENIESVGHLSDFEPFSQESQDLEPKQETELDREQLSDIQQGNVLQQEDADEYSIKGLEEPTSHDNLEVVTEITKQESTKEDEQDGQVSKDSETNQEPGLVEESFFGRELQYTFEQKSEEVCFSETTEEEISEETDEAISKTAERNTTIENQEDGKDSMNPQTGQETELNQKDVSEADNKPEPDHKSLSNAEAEIACQEESVLDFDKGTNEEIVEESSEVVSTMVENVFSEKNEGVQQLAQTESTVVRTKHESHTPEGNIEKYISGSENTEHVAHVSDVEPDSQESQDPEPEQKTELNQEQLFDIQQEIDHQQQESDEYSIKGPEEPRSHDNLEVVIKTTKQEITEENKLDSQIYKESEDNQGQDLVKMPLFSKVLQLTLATEEEISQETDEAISKEAEQVTTMENQEDNKDSMNPQADQEREPDQQDVSDSKTSYEQESIEKHVNESTEEEISQVSCETVSQTIEKDTLEENEEDSEDPIKIEVTQEPEFDHGSLSSEEAKTIYQQESVLDLGKDTDEEIVEESNEIVLTMAQNLFSEKNEEIEQLAQTESAAATTEHERQAPEIKTEKYISRSENVESLRHLSDVESVSQESQDPEPEPKPELDQEQLSDFQQEIALQQEDADEYSITSPEEKKSHDNSEVVTEITKQEATQEDKQDGQISKDSEANQGSGLVEEPLFDTELQFTLEQKSEEVCFSETTEERISQETNEAILRTAEQDTAMEIQEDNKDSLNSQADQETKFDQEDFSDTYEEDGIEKHGNKVTEEQISQVSCETVSESVDNGNSEDNEEDCKESIKIEATRELEPDHQPLSSEEAKIIYQWESVLDFDQGTDEEISEDSCKVVSTMVENVFSGRNKEVEHLTQTEPAVESTEHECDVKDINDDIHAEVSLAEDYSTSEEKQDGFTLISAEHENQCSESKLEDNSNANDGTQNNAQVSDLEATIQETFDSNPCPVLSTKGRSDSNIDKLETEKDFDQSLEDKTISQEEIEDEHLQQSCEEKEACEENFEAASTDEDFLKSEENDEIVSSQKEPEDDQKIPFSLTIIENKLRFTSENDAEVQPEKQECELSIDGTKTSGDLVVDEKRSECADLQDDDLEHDSFNKEVCIPEHKDFMENKEDNENSAKEEGNIVSEPSDQYLEPETNEQREEQPIASETESETNFVEQRIEEKLHPDNPAGTLAYEGPTVQQSEIEDMQTPSYLDDENSKYDESLDSQDISIYSQRSEDFEISKDYQLEQTLPDSTPLPNLDDEFEDLAEEKVAIIILEEVQSVAGSHILSEPKAEVLDDNLELQPSEIATELKAEELKQQLGDFSEDAFKTHDEPTFENKELEDSEVNYETFSQTVENTFEENEENSKDPMKTETNQEPEVDHKSLSSEETKICLQESVLDSDKGTDEDIVEERSEVVSKIVDHVFSEKNEDIVQTGQTETAVVSTEHESPTSEITMGKKISGSENTEIVSHLSDVESFSQEYQDPEPEQKPEPEQEQEISVYSQRSEDFDVSKDYQLEQTLPDSTPLPNLDEEFEDLAEKKVAIITLEEAQSVTGSHILPEPKAEVLDDNLELRPSEIATELKAEERKQQLGDFSEDPFRTSDEPTIDTKQLEDSEVNYETVSQTEEDTFEENEEDSKDPIKTEANQEPELDLKSLSSEEAKICQQESVLDSDKGTDEETVEEHGEGDSKIIANVFSEKNDEVEQLGQTESAVASTEHESPTSEFIMGKNISGSEPTEIISHLSDVEPISQESQDPEPEQKPEPEQEQQDISVYSQRSEDFEVSKDYQLEQTLQDSTPLPNLDEEFEDLVEEKVAIITLEEAQSVAGSHILLEPKAEVLDDNLELRPSEIATELKAEERKQQLRDFSEDPFRTSDEPTIDTKQLEGSVSKTETENTESDESLNSQEDIFQVDFSISSQRSDNLKSSTDYQLEETQPGATPLSNLTDGSEISQERDILEQEPPQNDEVKEFQKGEVEHSGLAVDESKKETTELFSTAEHPESEIVTLNNEIILEESTYTNSEQNVLFTGDGSQTPHKKENNIKENQSELVTEFASGLSTKFEIDNSETEDVIIISDHNRDSQIQSDEGPKTDPFETANFEFLQELKDGEEVQVPENVEHTQDDTDTIAKTTETSVTLESDHSLSSDEISPNVTAIDHETELQVSKSGGIEQTSPDIEMKKSSDESEKVGLKEVDETREDNALFTNNPSQEANIPECIELHASDEEKDIIGETSDSSFDSNSGNEREAAEEQHSSPRQYNIYDKKVNGLHGNTIVQATLDLEDLLVNGHSTGEQSKIVISERKTIVKVEEDIINIHTQDIIEESVLKFATSEGKSEGLFQSLLEKSEFKEGTLLDESSEIKNTIHTAIEYVDSATDESNYTKKSLMPFLRDSDINIQTEVKSPVVEDLIVDKDTHQQTVKTHQEKEDSWSSDE